MQREVKLVTARLTGSSQLAVVKFHHSCSERVRRALRQELDALLPRQPPASSASSDSDDGLPVLDDQCEPAVVHSDVKAFYVMLDAGRSARLYDFKSSRGRAQEVRPPSWDQTCRRNAW